MTIFMAFLAGVIVGAVLVIDWALWAAKHKEEEEREYRNSYKPQENLQKTEKTQNVDNK